MYYELVQAIPFCFAALFPVVNPIGSAVIFLSIAKGYSKKQLNFLAFKIAIYTSVLLISVLFLGSWILRIFGITVPIVLIGGGLVLAYIGWELLNQPAHAADKNIEVEKPKHVDAVAFYPLTMPVTAGPGCIAVVITLGAHSVSKGWDTAILSQIGNCIGILLMSLSVYLCYRYTHDIMDKLGTGGAEVIMRLGAFINLCIGLQLIWHGITILMPHIAS